MVVRIVAVALLGGVAGLLLLLLFPLPVDCFLNPVPTSEEEANISNKN